MFSRLTLVLLIVICTFQMTGCSVARMSRSSASIGNSRSTIGEVGVKKSLDYIGETIDDTLLVSADENGNGIISAGKGKLEVIPLVLNNEARSEMIDYLNKLARWGETACREKVEISKYLGYLSAKTGLFSGTSALSMEFISSAEGRAWLGKLHFCYIVSKVLGPTKPIGSGPCDRETTVYINPSSTISLMNLLEKVPEASNKAKYAKSKGELFN